MLNSLWLALMVSKNYTNNVGRLNEPNGAKEFTYANMRGNACLPPRQEQHLLFN
ncbi:MAG: hypothetical protein ABI358_13210 [Ginsengibacter sp.]